MCRRPGERLSCSFSLAVWPAGKPDTGPFHAQRPSVGCAVAGIVQDGENMVEQVFDTRAKAVEIALRRCRKVGAAHIASFGA